LLAESFEYLKEHEPPRKIRLLLWISTVLILAQMLIELVSQLREAGAEVSVARRPAGDFDAVLHVDLDGARQEFAVEVRSRAPYPNELDLFLTMHDHIADFGVPLLFAPSISEGVGRLLIERGWSWADSRGNLQLHAPGIRLRHRVPNRPPVHRGRASLPHGPGSLAIIRFLIRQSDEWAAFGPTELAKVGEVQQPRASQVLARLRSAGLVERIPEGWRADREALLNAFLNGYRGQRGTELYFYSLDPVTAAAREVVNNLRSANTKIAVSADVGPDLIAPWRSPSVAIIYAADAFDTGDVGLVPAHSRDDANVIVRVPEDTTVFRPEVLEDTTGMPLADEIQMIWDLHDLGGDDRIEAAGEMKKWLLTSR
jgi:DNA-binding transcriptional ArsR family regulator